MASSKLSDKAAKLDFSRLPGSMQAPVETLSAPPVGQEVRPKTAPGAMMAFANDARSELMRENEALRERADAADQVKAQLNETLGELGQWEGAKATRLIDPQQIRVSQFANRHELNYVGPEFMALRAEIESAGGNVQAIKVRSVAGPHAGGPRYELVYGHRRHRACLELGLPVLAVVDNVDDRALFVEMDRENRGRKDLSVWEQGTMYRRALAQGLFPSNRKLAEALGVDLSAVGKALAIADLPVAVIEAFVSPLDLQFRFAKPLMQALTRKREAVLRRARAIKETGGDRKPKAVLDQLVAAAGEEGVERFHPPVPTVVEVGGRQVATVEMQPTGRVDIGIEEGVLSAEKLPALTDMLREFLTKHG